MILRWCQSFKFLFRAISLSRARTPLTRRLITGRRLDRRFLLRRTFKSLALLCCCAFVVLAQSREVQAELIILNANHAFTIDFESTVSGVNEGAFTGAGVSASPTAGQLDSSAWQFDGFSSGTDLSRGLSTGGVTTGGLYAFTQDATGNGDRWLGVQGTGTDFTPGEITLRVLNQTGQTISDWSFGYDIKVLNNEDRSSYLNFAYSVGGGPDQFLSSLDYQTPTAADGSPTWETVARSSDFSATVDHGQILEMKWFSDDLGGSGSRDEFGLDNISITASASAVPEPSTWAFLMAIATLLPFRKRLRSVFSLFQEPLAFTT